MSDLVWTQEIDVDVRSALEAIIAASQITSAPVFIGPAAKGARPPFVTAWGIDPEWVGQALGSECWGKAHGRWQIHGHGVTSAQARYLAEILTDQSAWPAGWELVDIGPPVPDNVDDPPTWFWPLTFKFTG